MIKACHLGRGQGLKINDGLSDTGISFVVFNPAGCCYVYKEITCKVIHADLVAAGMIC